MHKLFWENPYQSTLETFVVSIDKDRVLFAETIAFSFSGGQESDRASINGHMVLYSEMEDNLIYYTLPSDHKLRLNEGVRMEIDWPRRYRLMRLHFAAELILELVTRKVHVEKLGAHIAETKARIDFVYDKNISCLFENVLGEYNEIIKENQIIRTGFIDIATQRRFWEIEGFSKVACGGTHVRTISEVGFISLKRINIGNKKERIEIKLLDENLAMLSPNASLFQK